MAEIMAILGFPLKHVKLKLLLLFIVKWKMECIVLGQMIHPFIPEQLGLV